MDEGKKSSMADVMRRYNEGVAAEAQKRKQAYQTAYERGEQILPWGLKNYLDSLPGLSYGESLNELTKRGGDMRAVYERAPSAIPAIVEVVVRELKLSPHVIAAALGLPPLPRDALDTRLLAVVRELAPEARNGLLPLARIAAAVNGDCAPHEGLTNSLLAQRLHALSFPFTRHHPVSVILIPHRLPSVLDAALTRLLPSPEELSAHEHTENGSRTQ